MKFWFDKGIDGFRMDVINLISKVPGLPDGEKTVEQLYGNGFPLTANGPRVHEFLQEMNKEVLSKYDIMTVGETPGVTPEIGSLYVGEDRRELNMLFQFEHVDVGTGTSKWDIRPWKLTQFKSIMSKWQEELNGKGWNSLYLNNHDQPRPVSRFGNDKEYRVESAKMLGTMLHMMQGTPYIYQGEELGMTNVKFSIDEYKDLEIINAYNELVKGGYMEESKFMEGVYLRGRDNARTPMQWDASEHAGFTSGTPWIRVNPNYIDINVENVLKDENSIFFYYQKLIKLRKENPLIVYGHYEEILRDSESIFAYIRRYEGETLLVVLNFYQPETEFVLPEEIRYNTKELLISNYPVDESECIKNVKLRPYEARVYRLR
jgi:oligo-1,6-glucosidase